MALELKVVSVQVGRAQTYEAEWNGEQRLAAWMSAIAKQDVSGPVSLTILGLEGDDQVDRKHHGGHDKAVLGYSAEHYPRWRLEHTEREWPHGAFGENLTIQGLDESSVCIGDEYAIGNCLLQVSQPRQPCWKLSRRWQMPGLADAVRRNGRTGWYYRVLQTGQISPGDLVTLVHRRFPDVTIAWAHAVMHDVPHQLELDQRLAACPALSESWRETLLKRSRAT